MKEKAVLEKDTNKALGGSSPHPENCQGEVGRARRQGVKETLGFEKKRTQKKQTRIMEKRMIAWDQNKSSGKQKRRAKNVYADLGKRVSDFRKA